MSSVVPEQTGAIGIIGGGCAGLVLADRLSAQNDTPPITLYDDGKPRPDHIWGYWDSGEAFMQAPLAAAKHSYPYWQIITPEGAAKMGGGTARYVAVSSAAYEAELRARLAASNRVTRIEKHLSPDSDEAAGFDLLYDTVSATPRSGGLLQHFKGVYVTADRPCFDPEIATLMDFRVDQSNGVHFIYLLPFSETEVLVESTLFSPALCDDAFYEAAIDDYLSRIFPDISFTHGARESGCIPMADLQTHTEGHAAVHLGLAGGALRASSGYAFYQIHRQINDWLNEQHTKPQAGASGLERWMDKVFLRVLRHHPQRAPEIFLSLGQALSGDNFAAFMNGHTGFANLARVIAAVPKAPFIRRVL